MTAAAPPTPAPRFELEVLREKGGGVGGWEEGRWGR